LLSVETLFWTTHLDGGGNGPRRGWEAIVLAAVGEEAFLKGVPGIAAQAAKQKTRKALSHAGFV